MISLTERMQFHAELRAYAQEREFKPGWAAFKFKEKFGQMPPWSWNTEPIAPPSLATRRWVQSRYIAWRKATERA
jgi:DNA repair protein RadD